MRTTPFPFFLVIDWHRGVSARRWRCVAPSAGGGVLRGGRLAILRDRRRIIVQETRTVTATSSKTANSERIGRGLGRAWRTLLRADARLATWMIGHGLSPGIARVLLWILKLALISALAFVALWLAVVLAVAAVLALVASHSSNRAAPFALTQHSDHRRNSFYDPNAYSDDPDPRWDDPN